MQYENYKARDNHKQPPAILRNDGHHQTTHRTREQASHGESDGKDRGRIDSAITPNISQKQRGK
jgi:hypothetical protein